jgi:hypothetical protein
MKSPKKYWFCEAGHPVNLTENTEVSLLIEQPCTGSELKPLTYDQGYDCVLLGQGLLHTAWGGDRWILSDGGMMIRGEKREDLGEIPESVLLHQESHLSHPALNPKPRGEKPVSSR